MLIESDEQFAQNSQIIKQFKDSGSSELVSTE